MEKRGILRALLVTILGGGIAAMIGAASLPSGSPYFDVLIYGGITAIAVSVLGLIGLAVTSSRTDNQNPEVPEEHEEPNVPDIRIGEAGEANFFDVRSDTGRQFLEAGKVDKISVGKLWLRKDSDGKEGEQGAGKSA